MQNLMLFGDGDRYPNFGIFAVNPLQIANNASYYRISIGGSSYNSTGEYDDEEQIAIFNNTIYVLCTAYPSETSVQFTLYHSSNLVNWTQNWVKNGLNSGEPCSIFGHIGASDNYLACGVISNAATGKNTYRIEIMSYTGIWSEYNTGLQETDNEDHPNVNFLTNAILLFEYSQRTTLNNTDPHELYLYDCSSNSLTYQATLPNYGYNDRIVMMDNKNNVYVSNCYTHENISSEIFVYQLFNVTLTPTPAPTTTPTISPIQSLPNSTPTPLVPSLSTPPTDPPVKSQTNVAIIVAVIIIFAAASMLYVMKRLPKSSKHEKF